MNVNVVNIKINIIIEINLIDKISFQFILLNDIS